MGQSTLSVRPSTPADLDSIRELFDAKIHDYVDATNITVYHDAVGNLTISWLVLA